MGAVRQRSDQSGVSTSAVAALVLGLSLVAGAGCSKEVSTAVNAPARQLPKNTDGAAYRAVFPGAWNPETGVQRYVAVRDVNDGNPSGSVAALDLLDASKDEVVPILPKPTALWSFLSVAPAGPERILFLNSPELGLGEVHSADLAGEDADAVLARPAPSSLAKKTYGDNVYFGASGDQILMLSNAEPNKGIATAYHWDGSGTPKSVAAQVSIRSVLFSRDRTTAVFAANYSRDVLTGVSIGDLVRLDMKSGQVQTIDNAVYIGARSFGTEGYAGSELGSDSLGVAYAISPAGTTVVYSKNVNGKPKVHRWVGGPNVPVSKKEVWSSDTVDGEGIFPGVSHSGKYVTYFDYRGGASKPVLHLWSVETSSDVYSVPVAPGAAFSAKFSPDERFVVFITNVRVAAQSTNSPAMGDLHIIPTRPPAETPNSELVIRLAKDVDWGSVRFGPRFHNQPTTSLSYLSNVKDLSGKPTLGQSTGELFGVDLTQGFPQGYQTPVATGIDPGEIQTLPDINGVAFEKKIGAGASPEYHPYLWVPGMTEARQLDVNETAGVKYQAGSLRTTGSVPSLSSTAAVRPDELAYIVVPIGAEISGGALRGMKVLGGGELPVAIDTEKSRQTYIGFSFDTVGRVVGLLAESGDSSKVVLWDLPFP